MKRSIFKGMMCLLLLGVGATSVYAQQQQRKDTLVVARDGTGEYRNIQEAVEAVRAFMDYTVTIFIKNGIYKEKLVIPSWVKNVQLVGESAEKTIITYDDHANINKMGTFRTYTVKVEGNDITFKDLTIENNAAPLGQAVALHTEGDRLMFVNCRFLGNQDTIYTGTEGARLLFTNCYIEGTTDFIFGPSTALFEYCELHSKRDSYITAASTPQSEEFGYVFKNCKLTAAPGVKKYIWVVRGVLMRQRSLSIVSLVIISVPKDGTIGRIRRTKRQPVMPNSEIRVRAQILPGVWHGLNS